LSAGILLVYLKNEDIPLYFRVFVAGIFVSQVLDAIWIAGSWGVRNI